MSIASLTTSRMQLFLAVIGLTAFSFAMRFWTMAHGLMGDELQTASIATTVPWDQFLQTMKDDGNPPLYYALLKLWASIFGGGDFSLKMCEVVINASIAPICYLIFYRQLGKMAALQIGLLVCIARPFIDFAELVRPYGLMALVALLATHQLTIFLKDHNDIRQKLLYAFLIAAGVYTHLTFVIMICAHIISIIMQALTKAINKQQVKAFFIAMLVAFVLCIPEINAVIYGILNNCQPAIRPISVAFCSLLIPLVMRPEGNNICYFIVALTFWECLACVVVGIPVFRKKYVNFDVCTWLTVIIGMVLTMFAFSMRYSFLWYFIYFVIPYLLVFVLMCQLLASKFPTLVAFSVPVLLWSLVWIPGLNQERIRHNNLDLLKICNTINKETEKSNIPALVVVSREWLAPGVVRYLDPRFKIVSLPDVEPVSVIKFTNIEKRMRDPQALNKLIAVMQKQLSEGGKIYHIYLFSFCPANAESEDSWAYLQARRDWQVTQWLDQHACKLKEWRSLGRWEDATAYLQEYQPSK